MKKFAILICTLAITTLVMFIGWTEMNKEYCCYLHKEQDGFVVKTRYEIILDAFQGIHYEEITLQTYQ